ncbi:E3 ubiquitin-protein ligase siah-1-like [Arctopsyche grandis]|uniref:E3 ubiquitin-protein ligase siah-1-like n=1 Tax=Arctopsyche grandis TaxID=121162 RepID=UPI00406DA208
MFKNNGLAHKEVLINNKLLLKELECTSCNKYMAAPIRQCISGHSMCEKCGDKNACAKCRSVISKVRNIHLENIAFKVKYPCKNLEGGCDSMFTHSELQNHEERCCHRLHTCLLNEGYCTWTGRITDLKSHSLYAHSREKVMPKKSLFICNGFKDITDYVRLVAAYKEVFWFFHVKRENTAYWAIQYLGPDVKCGNFNFDLKIHHAEDRERYVGFTKVQCFKNGDDMKTYIFASSATMNLDDLGNYLTHDNKAVFSIKVNKTIFSHKSKK